MYINVYSRVYSCVCVLSNIHRMSKMYLRTYHRILVKRFIFD